jgi:hypothetical protein
LLVLTLPYSATFIGFLPLCPETFDSGRTIAVVFLASFSVSYKIVAGHVFGRIRVKKVGTHDLAAWCQLTQTFSAVNHIQASQACIRLPTGDATGPRNSLQVAQPVESALIVS